MSSLIHFYAICVNSAKCGKIKVFARLDAVKRAATADGGLARAAERRRKKLAGDANVIIIIYRKKNAASDGTKGLEAVGRRAESEAFRRPCEECNNL
jgi:hypothetical protein